MRPVLVALVCIALALPALRGGDVDRARALFEHAESVAADDPTDPLWVDVHREWSLVRPWQRGFAEAQQRRREVEASRLSVLRDAGVVGDSAASN